MILRELLRFKMRQNLCSLCVEVHALVCRLKSHLRATEPIVPSHWRRNAAFHDLLKSSDIVLIKSSLSFLLL